MEKETNRQKKRRRLYNEETTRYQLSVATNDNEENKDESWWICQLRRMQAISASQNIMGLTNRNRLFEKLFDLHGKFVY